MADKPLFTLDAKEKWRLAYDSHQWVIQRREGKPSVRHISGEDGNTSVIRTSGYVAQSFVGDKKETLTRLFREKDIVLTPAAQAQFDALPGWFRAFVRQKHAAP